MKENYTMPYDQNRFANVKKNKNGSLLTIGKETKFTLKCDKHMNWLQKKMWKVFFGFEITDLKEN